MTTMFDKIHPNLVVSTSVKCGGLSYDIYKLTVLYSFAMKNNCLWWLEETLSLKKERPRRFKSLCYLRFFHNFVHN